MTNFNDPNSLQKANEQDINFKEEIYKYLQYWKWFVLSLIICLSIVYIKLRYTNNIYSTSAKIKITDPSDGLELPSQTFVFKRSNINLSDNIETLKSYPIAERVVNKLDLQVRFFSIGRLLKTEIVSLPLQFQKKENLIPGLYVLRINNKGIEIVHNQKSTTFIGFDTRKQNHNFPFDLIPYKSNYSGNEDGLEFHIIIGSKVNQILGLKSQLKIQPSGDNSNMLNISISGQSKKLSEKIIDTLMQVFIEDGIKDRQRISESTIKFINERFDILAKELDTVENENKEFKESRRIISIEAEAESNKIILDETNQNLNKLRATIQLAYDFKKNIFNKINVSKIDILPSSSFEDVNISSGIQDYNKLVLKYREILANGAGVENPKIKNIESQISTSKEIIKSSIEKFINDLETEEKLTKKLINEFDNKISSVPSDEKVYRSIKRQQKIKEALYILLLQKREEAYINKAITEPSAKIIEHAISNALPVSPKPNILYLGAALIGLLLPAAIVFLIYFLDTKIHTKEDLEKYAPSIPIVGEIPFIKNKNETLFINPTDRSVVSEAFRILSSNVNYILPVEKKDKCKVIFTTSTTKGEGKTFVSLNMSIAFSTLNKKVLLIGADLRNPQIHNYIDVAKHSKGLSDYLYDETFDWNSAIIQGFKNHPTHHILLSGSIPPNPISLLSNGRLEKIINEAKEKYDYIVVDTAPTILVTDTMLISQFADATVYLTRSAFTEKNILSHSKELKLSNKLKNIAYVLNGIGENRKYAYRYQYGYGYKYGYNYGYGYGYGSEK